MALVKIADLYPNYKDEIFGGTDIKHFSVYDYTNDKIGSVEDIIVDETGRFRYLVIDTGFWIFGKKVLLPIGRAKVDYAQERIYAQGLTKEQAENLPEYHDDMTIDYDYEEQVRGIYRGAEQTPNQTNYSQAAQGYNSNTYTYERDPGLYQLDRANHGDVLDYQANFMNSKDSFKLRPGVNLYKISDLHPSYHSVLRDDKDDLLSYSLYSEADDKVGSIKDILVDRDGHFRYLVVDTGFWIFGKKVLLPFGRARIDRSQKRVYAQGLTKEQAENLPEYDDDMTIDYDYEERVRGVYRTQPKATSRRNSYDYDLEPNLYAHQESDDRQNLKLYEERLVANKERFRTGTVTVGKRVETETATVSVPITKEKVIIERHQPDSSTAAVDPNTPAFSDREVARIDVYEESADIEKQAFVREEVKVRKEVEKDTVSARETVRREELEVDKDGDAVIDRDR